VKNRIAGFTLIEVMIAVAIIGILAAIAGVAGGSSGAGAMQNTGIFLRWLQPERPIQNFG